MTSADRSARLPALPGGAAAADLPALPELPMSRPTLDSDPPTALVRSDSFRELLPGTVVDEIYEIDARIGAGAMGEVYAATHIKLGKRVAIKVISRRLSADSAAIERFALEARTLAQIQHPAIVAVEHIGELADGRAYFVMEFLRGETLHERLQRGHVPLLEALRLLDQMARGLDAAHGEGVTHRDLKPENVFLVALPSEPPTVKLVDYGLAKLRADRADLDRRTERTQSGVAIGTPMYMSPEQMRGQGVDYRTDIYALGVVAYELLLGQSLFPHAQTAPELYAAHLHEEPPTPRSIWPQIPPALDLVMFAMVSKDPAHRPTLEQFRAVLATIRPGTAAERRAATVYVGPRPWRSRSRSRAQLTIGGILVALIGAVFGVLTTTHLPSRSRTTTPAPAPVVPTAATATIPPPPLQAPVATSTAVPPRATPRPLATLPSPPPTHHRADPPRPAQKPPAIAVPVATAIAPAPSGAPIAPTRLPPPAPKLDPNQTVNPFANKHAP